jgi:hypothetical protein
MTWENYLKSIDEKEINNWSDALKAFIKQGRELGIPLDVMSELENANKAAGATTTGVATFRPAIHNYSTRSSIGESYKDERKRMKRGYNRYGACPKCKDQKSKCGCE